LDIKAKNKFLVRHEYVNSILINSSKQRIKPLGNQLHNSTQYVSWWYLPGWAIFGALMGILFYEPNGNISPGVSMLIGAGVSVLIGLLFEEADWWNSVF